LPTAPCLLLLCFPCLSTSTLATMEAHISGNLRLHRGSQKEKLQGGPGWGDDPHTKYPNPTGGRISRTKPHGYATFNKEPGVTTYQTPLDACRACMTFFPSKEDGHKFHDPIHQDAAGGSWEQRCRAGPCDFRDPQNQPWGGMIGAGSEAFQDTFASWWRAPTTESCMTRDPVSWYHDCESMLLEDAKNYHDITQYCSYRNQIFVPPPADQPGSKIFAGATTAFTRLDASHENCYATIADQGEKLFSDRKQCDSDVIKLSGCCESVFEALHCVATEGKGRGISLSDQAGFEATQDAVNSTLQLFSQYCVPLCQYSKEEFCAHYPTSDICVGYVTCPDCTRHGGSWCEDTQKCECSARPGCAQTALQCAGPDWKPPPPPSVPKPITPPPPGPPPPSDFGLGDCKYLEMEKAWSQLHSR